MLLKSVPPPTALLPCVHLLTGTPAQSGTDLTSSFGVSGMLCSQLGRDAAKSESDPAVSIRTFSHSTSPPTKEQAQLASLEHKLPRADQSSPSPAAANTIQGLFMEFLPSLLPDLISIPLPFEAEFWWLLFQEDLPDQHHRTNTHGEMWWVLLDTPREVCVYPSLHSPCCLIITC